MIACKDKKILLIGGGGTLGTYTARELLALGAYVDILCPEEKVSDNERLAFIRGMGDRETLAGIFDKTRYDGIVNFIHYPKPDEYKAIHSFLMENTDHLIFLSSYRVYANEQHPITETAPRLYDVIDDPHLHAHETYAISKSICEDFLMNEHKGENWTIVRPVISFSQRRLDLLLYSGHEVLEFAAAGREMPMPETVRDYSAGIDWAGNSGKLIAHLLFKEDAMGEIFTVYSGHGLTWGEVADIYSDVTGAKMRWCPEKEFLDFIYKIKQDPWYWRYDRIYNRDIDCSKILRVTGLGATDFTSVRDGILTEIENIESGK